MKNHSLYLASIVLLFVIVSCEGPEGPEGPAGPAGANGSTGSTGSTGPQGPAGVSGNADVTQYNYAGFTFPATSTFTIPENTTTMDKSLLLCYVQNGSLWYFMPGYTSGGSNFLRLWYGTGSPSSSMTLSRVSGTGDITFDAMRILVAPASTVTNGRHNIDWSNYDEVATHFDLEK